MLRWLVGMTLLLGETTLGAQSLHFSDNENFAFKVKQIDEFMDRFNAVADTPIQQYVREQYAVDSLPRASLVLSLFDREDTTWNEPQVREFVADVAQGSAVLDFYDRGWYAELDCIGRYRGRKEQFTLVLSLEVLRNGRGSKWVIEGVSANFLQLGYSQDHRRALNPGSYGTDFMGLVDALQDTANVRNYLSTRTQPSQLLLFFNELCEGQLRFERVNAITYHFLQIDNWIFKVRDFNRDVANSGWLISELMKVTDVQKLQYREKILYLN